uniref:Uncharacterized protein n=1 Tax=Euplotes harpa TaxID=151035 RepID=A0A7S3NF19_9SPIT|mmetsp:Transcript_43337/g.50923  ORF Transcript_43337/g.50923 Transcript_43337/m.50923 type:complete len:162 (+) Transcript_43337:2593-3078(+)
MWMMLLLVPVIILADHFWKAFIMKQGYFVKPHRTIFESKKPKKLLRASPPAPEEQQPEEPVVEEKPKEAPPKKPISEKSETEGEDSEESEDESQSQVSESRPDESNVESSVNPSENADEVDEKPHNRSDGIEMNIFASDVTANANTAENFRTDASGRFARF